MSACSTSYLFFEVWVFSHRLPIRNCLKVSKMKHYILTLKWKIAQINSNQKQITGAFILITSLILTSFQRPSQKLDYQPSGPVVLFEHNGYLMYSDQASVLSTLKQYEQKSCRAAIKSFLEQKLVETKGDTLCFKSTKLLMDDTAGPSVCDFWSPCNTIFHLMERNKIAIVDPNGRPVKRIRIKKIRTQKKGLFKPSYTLEKVAINTDNQQTILHALVDGRIRSADF